MSSSTYRFRDAGTMSVKGVTELGDGDLLIAGLANDFSRDREDESFSVGAFRRGLGRFLAGPAALCYVHNKTICVGKVLTASVVEGVGVEITARVDRQLPGSPYYHIYEGVRKGTLSALSWGGLFEKEHTTDGVKIVGVDLLELSICPVGVGRNTRFSVIAGKALADGGEQAKAAAVKALREQTEAMLDELELSEISSQISRLETERAVLGAKATTDAIRADRETADRRHAVKAAQSAAKQRAAAAEEARVPMGDAASIERNMRWVKHRDSIMAKRQRTIRECEDRGEASPIFEPLPIAAPDWWEIEGRATHIECVPALKPGEVETAQNYDALGRRRKPAVEDLPLTPEEQFALADADKKGRKAILAAAYERYAAQAPDEQPKFATSTHVVRREVRRPISPEEAFAAAEADAAERARQARDEEALTNTGAGYDD